MFPVPQRVPIASVNGDKDHGVHLANLCMVILQHNYNSQLSS